LDWIDREGLVPGAALSAKCDYILKTYSEYIEDKRVFKGFTERVQSNFLKDLEASELIPREGFWSLVYKLKEDKKMKLGLNSNGSKVVVEKTLDKIGVHNTFDTIVTGDDVKRPKPDPEMYKLLAKKLGVVPKEVLVFEDSIIGSAAAFKAGMDLVVIKNGEINKLFYPDNVKLYINDFSNIANELDTDVNEDIKAAAKEIIDEKKEQKEEQKTQQQN